MGFFIFRPLILIQFIVDMLSRTLKICLVASVETLNVSINGEADANAIEAPIEEKNTYSASNLSYIMLLELIRYFINTPSSVFQVYIRLERLHTYPF